MAAAMPADHQPSLTPVTKTTTTTTSPMRANTAHAVVLESSKREFA